MPQNNDPLNMIAEKRASQIENGYTPEGDDAYTHGELAKAAVCYATPHTNRQRGIPALWPWHGVYWNPPLDPDNKTRIKELVSAGACIVAEIERLQRIKTYNDVGPTISNTVSDREQVSPELEGEVQPIEEVL